MCKHRAVEKKMFRFESAGLHSEMCLGPCVPAKNKKGGGVKLFRKKNRHTCGSGSSSQPARQKNGN